MKRFVAYTRVSTKRQGESGLGLEAQLEAVRAHVEREGGKLATVYTEVESGKRADRPELAKAIAHAKRSKAVLVVAKLDRLARNVAFLSALMDSGADFLCCDNPHANRLTVHILAAVAEDERRRISERTAAALAVKKRRGVKLGSARPGHWNGREARRLAGARKGARRAAVVHKTAADTAYTDLEGEIRGLREQGSTLQAIADRLNEQGHTTRRGGRWFPSQVRNVLLRFERIERERRRA